MNKLIRISLLFLFVLLGKKQYSQFYIDTSIVASYDSSQNYYLFKPNTDISVSNLMSQYKSTFRVRNQCDFIQTYTVSDNLTGGNFYKYQQRYNGILVEGSCINVVYNSLAAPVSANGITFDIQNLNTSPVVDASEAINSAIVYVPAEKYYWQDSTLEADIKEEKGDTTATNYPANPPLVIYPVMEQGRTSYVLCYKIRVSAMEPSNVVDVFVNAVTGIVENTRQISVDCFRPVASYSKPLVPECEDEKESTLSPPLSLGCSSASCQQGSANLHKYGSQYVYTDKFPYGVFQTCTYRLKDNCTGTTLYTRKYVNPGPNIVDIRDNSNVWTNGGDDQDGTTAHFSLRATHDYYRTRYGRNSWNGNYSQLSTYINWAYGSPNAQFTGNSILVSKPYSWQHPVIFFDGIGHEFTHGVTQTTAYLTYSGESGALNEGFSDIFGTLIEYYGTSVFNTGQNPNYLIGELSDVSDGGIRNMAYPNQFNQPDTYNGTYWASTSGGDNGGVHTNSGVLNYWFYLLAEGGSGTNDLNNAYCVRGIGRDKAADIAWRTLTMKLYPSASYANCAFLSIQSAADLYGPNSDEVAQVTAAWYAVGVGSQFNGQVNIQNITVNTPGVINKHYNAKVQIKNVTVNNGTSSTTTFYVSSNTEIEMLPDVNYNQGIWAELYIAPACTGGARLADSETGDIKGFIQDEYAVTNVKKENVDVNNELKVFPNPTSGNFTVESTYDAKIEIRISDAFGRKINQFEINKGKNDVQVEGLPAGIYLLDFITESKSIERKKLVIAK